MIFDLLVHYDHVTAITLVGFLSLSDSCIRELISKSLLVSFRGIGVISV